MRPAVAARVGVGLLEGLAEKFPKHAAILTSGATMEWLNVHMCEEFGHDSGMHVSLERAAKLAHEGYAFAQHIPSFEFIAKLVIVETAAMAPLFERMIKGAGTPELRQFGVDLLDHENALRDWCKSELDGKSDGGEKVLAWLERHGISREEAVIPRRRREDVGDDKQHLVLASFADEAAADRAARMLKNWEKAS